jgi:hypothetical protein
MAQTPSPRRETPTQTQALIFRGKAALLQMRRGFANFTNREIKRHPFSNSLKNQPVIAESKTALWTESDRAEQFLLAGKVQNLRQAIKKLNGIELAAGATFSFWAQIGRATKSRGYVAGRELREGCIIPNVGGGLCQLSNALYDAALQANCEIVECHAHTQVIPGSLAEKGRDATVFWNYVDLRFKSAQPIRIEVRLDANNLIVKFRGEKAKPKLVQIAAKIKDISPQHSPNSCATCGVEECFRSLKPQENLDFGRTAFLVDEYSLEFDAYLQENRKNADLLFLPLDGKRFKKANYAWTINGFKNVRQSWLTTAIRAYKSRKLAAQGAARQRNLLTMCERLAESYAKKLPFDATHIVLQQNLLPFLWKSGVLGGRTFDVLMTALPMTDLQERLNLAANLHPESKTLADFRAEEWLIESETEALANARRIITPHSEIAALFAEKGVLLDWKMPVAKTDFVQKARDGKFTIVFPASTVGRKGCYELREAVRGLDVKLIILGAEIEGADFWRGFEVEHQTADWLEKADLVVLPAFVEHKPRRLLLAAAHNIPVIASTACGIENVDAVKIINAGETTALLNAIENAISLTKPTVSTVNQVVEIV